MDDRRRRFEVQVLPHLDAGYRLARWLAHSRDGVDDVVQEAVLRAFRGFDGLKGTNAKSWFMAIVRNCHRSANSRSSRAWVPLPEEDDIEDGHIMVAATVDPENAAVQSEEARALRSLIEALPEDWREVLVLREFEEMDYRQIATVTQAPLGTVMSRLSRARAALRKGWLHQQGEFRAVP